MSSHSNDAALPLWGSASALLAFCRETLGPRAPRIIHAFPDLPRTATGKVLKRELAQRLAELLAAAGRTL